MGLLLIPASFDLLRKMGFSARSGVWNVSLTFLFLSIMLSSYNGDSFMKKFVSRFDPAWYYLVGLILSLFLWFATIFLVQYDELFSSLVEQACSAFDNGDPVVDGVAIMFLGMFSLAQILSCSIRLIRIHFIRKRSKTA